MQQLIEELSSFINQSPTAFHAVYQVRQCLEKNGFQELAEHKDWNLVPGGRYYVIRNDASVMAFVVPKQKIKGFHVFAAHSDSPSFKVKYLPQMKAENYYVKLNIEKYGGMIMATWLDRPLSVAGRVYIKGECSKTAQIAGRKGNLTSVLINMDKNLCVIPNVAIHMNREMNQNLSYNPQVDMLPLLTLDEQQGEKSFDFEKQIAESIGVSKEQILGSELYLYNRDKACRAGARDELFMAPRIDDLECVFSGLQAIISTEPTQYVNMLAIFHNEEVGSLTRQGADSTFWKDTMENIVEGLDISCFALYEDEKRVPSVGKIMRTLVNESFLLSADNAHALHPNHMEKADLTNRPVLNKGIVLKFHGGQKYATDAYSEAVVRELASQAGIPVQTYCNRADIAGGSTLGNIAMAQVSMPAADIGLAQLAMHSAMETAGCADVEYMVRLVNVFFAK